jgi:hypothetical protein
MSRRLRRPRGYVVSCESRRLTRFAYHVGGIAQDLLGIVGVMPGHENLSVGLMDWLDGLTRARLLVARVFSLLMLTSLAGLAIS